MIAFDLPVGNSDERKIYRSLRKKLLSSGFIPLQKSIFCCWAENGERAEIILNRFRTWTPPCGCMLFMKITDTQFRDASLIQNGKKVPMPKIPSPWNIL